MEDVAKIAQIVVTTTGCKDVVRGEHMTEFPNDCIICNVGHFDVEIDVKWLNSNAVSSDSIKPQVTYISLFISAAIIMRTE